MTPRFLIGPDGLNPQAFLLAVLLIALTVAALSLLLQPSSQVDGQERKLPVVSLLDDVPSSIDEGGSFQVTVRLNRTLSEAIGDPEHTDYDPDNVGDKFRAICYHRPTLDDDETPCIEGGILVLSHYNDGTDRTTVDELVAFVFKPVGNEEEQKERVLTARFADDDCLAPQREVQIAINTSFGANKYGYTIDGYDYGDDGYPIREDEFVGPTVTVTDNDSTECGVKGVSVEPTQLILQRRYGENGGLSSLEWSSTCSFQL